MDINEKQRKETNMKILVLGGTGAMGVDLVKNLARRGENVTVTSRIKRKSELENVRYIQGNAHDSVFLQTLLNDNFDVIVDLWSTVQKNLG